MDRNIKADLYRYDKETSVLKGLLIPGFNYMYFWRKASKLKKSFFCGFIYKVIVRRLSIKYGYQIPLSTQIGEGFYIGHFGAVVINGACKIGKNCNVAHGITIGQTNRGRLKGSPILGDKVWVGTGAVIVGKITIGNNVLIAPNAYVNFDVPDNSIVVGNPAKIIANKNATDEYICNALT